MWFFAFWVGLGGFLGWVFFFSQKNLKKKEKCEVSAEMKQSEINLFCQNRHLGWFFGAIAAASATQTRHRGPLYGHLSSSWAGASARNW